MTVSATPSTLNLADHMRQTQQWGEAVRLYSQLETQLPHDAVFQHNFALSLLGAKQAAQAVLHADKALALQPALWQSVVVKVRALTALGQMLAAASVLDAGRLQFPERAEFALELASMALHQQCDARLARQLVQPHLSHPSTATATDACLTDIMASLYDRDDSAQSLNSRVMQFARNHLERAPGRAHSLHPAVTAPSGRQRLGLLSPHLNCSPVYFFCSGALRLLAAEFDLYFFSRSQVTDWASAELQRIAHEWFDVTHLSAERLDIFLRQQSLDVLVDLGGWMDPIALQAISTKPAKRMYKWVGGQSITTGLKAFDGFITDLAQTPLGFEPWFSEPLVRLPQGYVSYSPPPYMPAPVAASQHSHVLGVIANPVKVSQSFLTHLAATLPNNGTGLPTILRFIDKRYGHRLLQNRIQQGLASVPKNSGDPFRVEFVSPTSHLNYLTEVGQLSAVAETFPYSGGLTLIEALSLGVPCGASPPGTLFCERHAHAHQRYLQSRTHPRIRAHRTPLGKVRPSLIPADCPRSDHQALAQSLAQLFATGQLESSAE